MFTYKKAPYKIFSLGPKFCWAGPGPKPSSRSQALSVSPIPSSLLSQLRFVLAVTDLALSHNPMPLSSSSPMAISVTWPHFT